MKSMKTAALESSMNPVKSTQVSTSQSLKLKLGFWMFNHSKLLNYQDKLRDVVLPHSVSITLSP